MPFITEKNTNLKVIFLNKLNKVGFDFLVNIKRVEINRKIAFTKYINIDK